MNTDPKSSSLPPSDSASSQQHPSPNQLGSTAGQTSGVNPQHAEPVNPDRLAEEAIEPSVPFSKENSASTNPPAPFAPAPSSSSSQCPKQEKADDAEKATDAAKEAAQEVLSNRWSEYVNLNLPKLLSVVRIKASRQGLSEDKLSKAVKEAWQEFLQRAASSGPSSSSLLSLSWYQRAWLFLTTQISFLEPIIKKVPVELRPYLWAALVILLIPIILMPFISWQHIVPVAIGMVVVILFVVAIGPILPSNSPFNRFIRQVLAVVLVLVFIIVVAIGIIFWYHQLFPPPTLNPTDAHIDPPDPLAMEQVVMAKDLELASNNRSESDFKKAERVAFIDFFKNGLYKCFDEVVVVRSKPFPQPYRPFSRYILFAEDGKKSQSMAFLVHPGSESMDFRSLTPKKVEAPVAPYKRLEIDVPQSEEGDYVLVFIAISKEAYNTATAMTQDQAFVLKKWNGR